MAFHIRDAESSEEAVPLCFVPAHTANVLPLFLVRPDSVDVGVMRHGMRRIIPYGDIDAGIQRDRNEAIEDRVVPDGPRSKDQEKHGECCQSIAKQYLPPGPRAGNDSYEERDERH